MDNEEIAYRPGDVLADKYKVDRVIGMGGFGAVLAATHLKLDQRVAVKILLPHAAKNAAAAERFMREARAAVKIRSEHVATVKDVGQLSDGTPYMEMEFLEGQDLSNVLKTSGGQAVHDVAEWVLQACEAIAEAHSLGIVHRDLKPANLFLTRKVDGAPCVKVLDFGISKMSNELGDKGMTKTSDVMGSPFYMSPEQMRSTRSVDARSDIWALGAILYEMLAGAPPFDAETMTALVVSIMQEPPRELGIFRRDIPPAFRDVIMRCLQKDPAQRFQDVAGLAAALAAFAPQRAQQNLQRVFAISGRSSNPMVSSQPSSNQRASLPQATPGAHTLSEQPASVAFHGQHAQSGQHGHAQSGQHGHAQSGQHGHAQSGQHGHAQSGQHGPQPTVPGYPHGHQSGSHSGSHSYPPAAPQATEPGDFGASHLHGGALPGNAGQLAGASGSPAQSWGGTYMGSKKPSSSKAPLIVGLIAVSVLLIGGGGGAYYFATQGDKSASKSAKSSDDDEDDDRKSSKRDDDKTTASATATASATVVITAEPVATAALAATTQQPTVEPVASSAAPTTPTTPAKSAKPTASTTPTLVVPTIPSIVVQPPPPPPPPPPPKKPPPDPMWDRPD
ncbi:MAG: protein kinase [Polyangiaceae bacterium]|jgi:serine/threonine protein kinase|nr:protein kinase [Polyangiaceae bacterium]